MLRAQETRYACVPYLRRFPSRTAHSRFFVLSLSSFSRGTRNQIDEFHLAGSVLVERRKPRRTGLSEKRESVVLKCSEPRYHCSCIYIESAIFARLITR